ncbi:MAG TPA: hypothetical protein LFV91_00250 [Rickettsia endosymbiont of Bembidion nr. Transversale]|nr:hypothetical protein [Rickettsia endosymbiont of Bembidion nr. Transversale]
MDPVDKPRDDIESAFRSTQQCRHGVTLKTFVNPRNKAIYFLPNKRSISLSLSSI